MRTLPHSPSESNQPHTLESWAIALPDDPQLELAQAHADRLQIDTERSDELADLARLEAWQDAQQMADLIDSGAAMAIGTPCAR